MKNFIMFIFKSLIYLFMPVVIYSCDNDFEQINFYTCLNNWRLISDFHLIGYAGFLRDPSLLDDVCLQPGGYSTNAMNDCIQRNVKPKCESIKSYWKGLKAFADYICLHREKFIRTGCRKNVSFQGAYEMCMAKTKIRTSDKEESCRKYEDTKTCLHRAVREHCSKVERRFLIEAINLRDSPTIEFACSFRKTTVPAVEIEPLFMAGSETNLAEITENGAKQWCCYTSVWLIMIIYLLQRLI